jgi:hypothetical protein
MVSDGLSLRGYNVMGRSEICQTGSGAANVEAGLRPLGTEPFLTKQWRRLFANLWYRDVCELTTND